MSTDSTATHPQPVPAPAPAPTFGLGIADPGPLGLAGFAATTLFLSAANAGLLSASVTLGVLGLAFFYGGLAQLLAGLWEFVKGNTFGATAFVSFGAFWLSFWYLETHAADDLKGATLTQADHAVGTFLLVWTIFTAYMFIASLRTTGAIAAVFLFLAATFLFLCIGNYDGSVDTVKIGGYLGLITAAFAFYGSFAGVTNSTFRKTVLPVFPLQPR